MMVLKILTPHQGVGIEGMNSYLKNRKVIACPGWGYQSIRAKRNREGVKSITMESCKNIESVY